MSHPFPITPLGEVLIERQETPASEALTSGEIKIVSKIGFEGGTLQLRSDGETKTKMILVRPGDLVVSGINAAKGAIAIYGEGNTAPIAATIHYGAYIPKKEKVDIKYLWWLLRSRTFRELLAEYVPGGIKTELKAKRLLPVPVPMPKLPEQQRIVARIEELAKRINEAYSLQQKAIEERGALIQSTLGQIITNDQIDGTLTDILSSPPRNGWSATCDNIEGGIPVLALSAVTGFRYRSASFKRTSSPISPNAYFWLAAGDFLMTRSNTPEFVGHAAIYDGNPSPCIYPDLIMRLDFRPGSVDQRFVWYWLQAPIIRDYIRQKAKGTSPTMKKISQRIVMSIPFPSSLKLPNQNKIVTKLDALQEKVDALKHLQDRTAAELDALLPSILDKAFKGEI